MQVRHRARQGFQVADVLAGQLLAAGHVDRDRHVLQTFGALARGDQDFADRRGRLVRDGFLFSGLGVSGRSERQAAGRQQHQVFVAHAFPPHAAPSSKRLDWQRGGRGRLTGRRSSSLTGALDGPHCQESRQSLSGKLVKLLYRIYPSPDGKPPCRCLDRRGCGRLVRPNRPRRTLAGP
ncbi:hypothetical protein D3C80_1620440 [compost metagenome]